MNTQNTLNRLGLNTFSPPPLLRSPLAQTVVPYYLPIKEKPIPGEFCNIPLNDGDQIVAQVSLPKNWRSNHRLVVLIHGLAGSQDSPYITRIGEKFFKRGYGVVKMNLRSCGPGRGLAKKPYHSGRSEDSRQLLHWLEEKFPDAPVTQIGFSLSANMTLKMLGEETTITDNLDSAIAVSPPLDLAETARMITQESFGLFDLFFLLQLKKHYREYLDDFPQSEKVQWPKKMSIIDFDELYTAPRSGFDNAADYYAKASSLQFVPRIQKKTLILHSTDDPVVDSKCLSSVGTPKNIDLLEFDRGGHVGFLDNKGFWLDEALLRWVHLLDH